MLDDLVTVLCSSSPGEADHAREKLATEGIRAYVVEEQPGERFPEMRVQVAPEDADRARKILGTPEVQKEESGTSDDPWESDPDDEDEESDSSKDSWRPVKTAVFWLILVPWFIWLGVIALKVLIWMVKALRGG